MMMKRKNLRIAAAAAVAAAFASSAALATIPAFPGAQGPGGNATGGRGGDVYHVTKLDFDLNGVIPGSLKYGINNAPSAGRTIVFDVGGTIFQNGGGAGWWFRSSKSNITVAGQTAPGPGITIAGVGSKWTGDNVILRNMTVRPNKDPSNPTNFTYDAFSLQTTNSIVDHVTATWATDEAVSITDAGFNSTVQYALMGEGLNYQSHAYGSIINSDVNDANYSYHHNLYAHLAGRLPALGAENGTGPIVNFSNNVIYNWPATKAGYSATGQHSRSNWIGNYYITGPSRGNLTFSGGDDANSIGFTQIYVENKNSPVANKSDWNRDGVLNGNTYNATDTFNGSNKYYSGSQTFMSNPFTVNGVGVPDSADDALQRVTNYGGANWQNRNPIDARIINTVGTQTGAIISDLTGATQSAEWSTVMSQRPDANGNAPFARAANFDTDQDGMPDTWELAHGLNPNSPSNNGDFDNDGYTNLEEYINELSEWPASVPIVFDNSNGTGRFEEIRNWNIDWQPSRFDEAQINSGTVTINSVGQHAGVLKVNATATGSATLAVSAGWIDVASQMQVGAVAAGGTGWVVQTGGLVQVNGTLTVGAGVASNSVYELTGGTLVSGPLKLVGGAKLVTVRNATNVAAVSGLSIDTANGSAVDLNSAMIVGPGSTKAQVEALVASGRNGGAWDGAGVRSSAAASAPATGIGVLSGAEYASAGGGSTFAGIAVGPTDTLVKYTWNGDANLDGRVTFDDYVKIDTGFNTALTGWFNGDFNYSGNVNFDDYVLIDIAFNQQNGTLSRAIDWISGDDRSGSGRTATGVEIVTEHLEQFGAAYGAAFLAAVPEPTCVTVLGLAVFPKLSQRRRRCQRYTSVL